MNIDTLKQFIRYASVPIILLGFFLMAAFLYQVLDAPSEQELIESAREFYEQYGYWVVFVAALIEGMLFVNWYFPGSVVAVLGVVFARDSALDPVIVVSVIIGAFVIAAVLNYLLGRFGWYHVFLSLGLRKPLEDIKKRIGDKGLAIIFTTYIHPNIGALVATSAGILRLPFKRFFWYSVFAFIFWNTLWGTAAYVAGPIVLNALSVWVLIIVMIVWIVYLGVRYKRKKDTPTHIP